MILRNDTDRAECIKKIQAIDLAKPWQIDAAPFKKNRSLAQNKLSFSYYNQLGKATGHGVQYDRNYCKFTFGCPILLADDKDGSFTQFYESIINRLEYEQLIDAMEFIEVTRLFNVGQFQDYLIQIEQFAFSNHYALIPDDDLRCEAIK